MKKKDTYGGISRSTYSSSKVDASSPILTLENMEKLYAQASVFDNMSKGYKLPWWKKIIFFFLPTIVSQDIGYGGDKSVVLRFKKWRGTLYLIDESLS